MKAVAEREIVVYATTPYALYVPALTTVKHAQKVHIFVIRLANARKASIVEAQAAIPVPITARCAPPAVILTVRDVSQGTICSMRA